MSTGPAILIVDDERTLARAIRAYLAEAGYEAEVAESAEQALQILPTLRPDVVVTDVRLPGMTGIDLLRRIREMDPGIVTVVMTAHGTIEGAVEAMKLGAFDYLKKPLDLEELKLVADRAREAGAMREELSYHRARAVRDLPFADLIGRSPAMQAVLERARQIAALDETPPVLITGETGTGKGLIARTIHTSGPRGDKPFIDVNCTAIPASLMEAELFGHERGAFTDAKETRMGLFEAAEGGFIFLDEIGDLELQLQGKLLKAIEERVVRRVGGVRDRKIDVRILAATNRDLEAEAAKDRFRRDLYFRLAVIILRLPPLRERGDDVLLLAEHFLQRLAAKYGRNVRRLHPEASAALLAHSWPGNVRELSHVMERAVLWSRGEEVTPAELGLTPPRNAAASAGSSKGVPFGAEMAVSIGETAERRIPTGEHPTLEAVERSLLEQALRETGGNQTRAAQRLGISRDTLRYRMKKHGLGG
jgi:two-component system response regulator AtoC